MNNAYVWRSIYQCELLIGCRIKAQQDSRSIDPSTIFIFSTITLTEGSNKLKHPTFEDIHIHTRVSEASGDRILNTFRLFNTNHSQKNLGASHSYRFH